MKLKLNFHKDEGEGLKPKHSLLNSYSIPGNILVG